MFCDCADEVFDGTMLYCGYCGKHFPLCDGRHPTVDPLPIIDNLHDSGIK